MKKQLMMVGILVGLLLGFTVSAQALTFDLNYAFSGSSPSGTAPWLTATFADDGANTVVLTLQAHLATSEFVSEWAFNITDISKIPLGFTYDNLNSTGTSGIQHRSECE